MRRGGKKEKGGNVPKMGFEGKNQQGGETGVSVGTRPKSYTNKFAKLPERSKKREEDISMKTENSLPLVI